MTQFQYFPSLIEPPEKEFSGTYSATPSIRPWVQNLLTEEAGVQHFTDFDRQFIKRFSGMALLWYMPATGLDETLQMLTDTFRFLRE